MPTMITHLCPQSDGMYQGIGDYLGFSQRMQWKRIAGAGDPKLSFGSIMALCSFFHRRINDAWYQVSFCSHLIGGPSATVSQVNAQATPPASKQAATSLTYGKTVKGEITSSVTAINYTFAGKANDVVVIIMKPDGLDSNLTPLIKLLGTKKTALGDTSKGFTFLSAVFAIELPIDGTYTIVATRAKADKLTTGKFVLSLKQAKPLEDGKPFQDKTDNSSTTYYAIHATGPFSVAYQKTGGDFAPTVDVNTFDEGALKSVATLNGAQVSKGNISVTSDPDIAYILTVGVPLFSFSFEKTSVEYSVIYTIDKS